MRAYEQGQVRYMNNLQYKNENVVEYWRIELLFHCEKIPWALIRIYDVVSASHAILKCAHLQLDAPSRAKVALRRLDLCDPYISAVHIIPDWSDKGRQRFFHNQFSTMLQRDINTELGCVENSQKKCT